MSGIESCICRINSRWRIAFLVLAFGDTHHNLAAVTAAAAVVITAALGVVVHRPLTRVPQSTMKFGVGLMLCAFGTSGEQKEPAYIGPAGMRRSSDFSSYYAVVAGALVALLRRRSPVGVPAMEQRT